MMDIEAGKKNEYELTGTVQIFPLVNIRAVENSSPSWEFDNLNMEMAFPGNESGDLNEKICESLLSHTTDSTYGIILQAGDKHFYDYPHIKLFDSSRQKRKIAEYFDLEIVRTIQDTPPRNLHLASYWEDNEVETFIISAGRALSPDNNICDLIFDKIIRFMLNAGLLKYSGTIKKISQVRFFKPENETTLVSPYAGLFQPYVSAGQSLKKEQKVGSILEVYSGETIGDIIAPEDGILISFIYHTIVHQQQAIGEILIDKKSFLSWPFSR
ncbi:MAG: succinylglutamate desuccinylase/aspartoacylase family protein [Nitrospinales bacterium]